VVWVAGHIIGLVGQRTITVTNTLERSQQN
jgi:hypothetical protein